MPLESRTAVYEDGHGSGGSQRFEFLCDRRSRHRAISRCTEDRSRIKCRHHSDSVRPKYFILPFDGMRLLAAGRDKMRQDDESSEPRVCELDVEMEGLENDLSASCSSNFRICRTMRSCPAQKFDLGCLSGQLS